jgi:hypothetical protein
MGKLKDLAELNNINITPQDRSLVQVIQESYKLDYSLPEGELKDLVKEHLVELRTNPTEVVTLSEGLDILLEMVELGESAVTKAKPRTGTKDLARSKAMKKAWKQNGGKMKKALGKFRKSSKGKAFYKSLGKFNAKMNDSTEMTLEESVQLFKAGNSALTHLAVELEHNPDFQEVFSEAASILSQDLNALLESIIAQEIPETALLESFSDFHSILTDEDEEEL